MISVILQTDGSSEAVARSFVPLVSGAMEGVVREVIIWSPDEAASDDLHLLCDGAGARLIEGKSSKDVLAAARSDWLLLLEPGAILWGDWHGGVLLHINKMKQAGHFQLSSQTHHAPWWRRILGGHTHNAALRRGCLIPKAMAVTAAKSSLQSIANGRSFKVINGGAILPPHKDPR